MLRPMVSSHRLKRLRKGRGFSIKELRSQNLNPRSAQHLGIAVDMRRKTTRKENIEALKNILNSLSTPSKKSSHKSKNDSNKN